jgi:hypothetical protein
LRRFEATEDEHQRQQVKELGAEAKCIIAASDSGAKGDVEHCPQTVAFYLESDDLVVRLLLAVPRVPSTSGADLASAHTAAWQASGLDLHKQIATMSDTCASMTGRHKGAVQLVRKQTGNVAVATLPCLAHVFDLALRKGLQQMSGVSDKW